jgi:hypothetical protein
METSIMAFLVSRPSRSKRPFRQRRSFVPQLEILEDRTVPSTLTVTNNLDKGAGSLRNTIKTAQSGDTIVFAPSLDGQTITLTSDQLTINKSLDIEGPGTDKLAVSGGDANRIFKINAGLSVTIAGLTITHGQARGSNGGGGILNSLIPCSTAGICLYRSHGNGRVQNRVQPRSRIAGCQPWSGA